MLGVVAQLARRLAEARPASTSATAAPAAAALCAFLRLAFDGRRRLSPGLSAWFSRRPCGDRVRRAPTPATAAATALGGAFRVHLIAALASGRLSGWTLLATTRLGLRHQLESAEPAAG